MSSAVNPNLTSNVARTNTNSKAEESERDEGSVLNGNKILDDFCSEILDDSKTKKRKANSDINCDVKKIALMND